MWTAPFLNRVCAISCASDLSQAHIYACAWRDCSPAIRGAVRTTSPYLQRCDKHPCSTINHSAATVATLTCAARRPLPSQEQPAPPLATEVPTISRYRHRSAAAAATDSVSAPFAVACVPVIVAHPATSSSPCAHCAQPIEFLASFVPIDSPTEIVIDHVVSQAPSRIVTVDPPRKTPVVPDHTKTFLRSVVFYIYPSRYNRLQPSSQFVTSYHRRQPSSTTAGPAVVAPRPAYVSFPWDIAPSLHTCIPLQPRCCGTQSVHVRDST